MRRTLFIIFISSLLILCFSCKSKKQNFYHGYVYNGNKNKPLQNVFVRESFKSNFLSTKTDSSGYFKIINNSESIGELIFSCDGFKTDTIGTVWTQHGESLKYLFLNKVTDTVFLKPNQ